MRGGGRTGHAPAEIHGHSLQRRRRPRDDDDVDVFVFRALAPEVGLMVEVGGADAAAALATAACKLHTRPTSEPTGGDRVSRAVHRARVCDSFVVARRDDRDETRGDQRASRRRRRILRRDVPGANVPGTHSGDVSRTRGERAWGDAVG